MKSFIIFPSICSLIWVLAILTIFDIPKKKKFKIILSAILTCVLTILVIILNLTENIVDYLYIDHRVLLIIFATVFPLTYLINSYLYKSIGLIFILRLSFLAVLCFGILYGLYFVTLVITIIFNPEHLH